MSRILVTGGTGFVGSRLVEDLLDDGHAVTVVGRDAGRIRLRFGGRVRVGVWSHPNDPSWIDELNGHDAIVHLAGAQAVGTRFTPGSKERIRDSRVKTTRELVSALAKTSSRPSRFVSASAVGYYGPQSPGKELDETAPCGTGFLAELCHEWESAAERASEHGIAVVRARLGIVIGPNGGAFEAMARPFRFGIGGHLGNGRQDISFVSLTDAVRALRFCMDHPSLSGAVNVTSPRPVNGRQLAATLGSALRRPNWLPVPAAALRALYGEGAEALVTGQRAMPKVLERAGFEWKHPDIEQAVATAAVGNAGA